jgi:hypothetical protein
VCTDCCLPTTRVIREGRSRKEVYCTISIDSSRGVTCDQMAVGVTWDKV